MKRVSEYEMVYGFRKVPGSMTDEQPTCEKSPIMTPSFAWPMSTTGPEEALTVRFLRSFFGFIPLKMPRFAAVTWLPKCVKYPQRESPT